MRLKIPAAQISRAAGDAALAALRRNAGAAAAIMESQTKARFESAGDEELTWPDLWVNDPEKVRAVTKTKQADEARAKLVASAQKSLDRLEKKISTGKLTASDARKKRQRAREKLKRARQIQRDETTDLFRQGGQPLRDTGALMSSITSLVTHTTKGVRIDIGTPLDYGRYQQDGFKTNGPNYIPLTAKARGGWHGGLVRGFDYAVLKSVTVPARPFVRITTANRREIINALTGRAGGAT